MLTSAEIPSSNPKYGKWSGTAMYYTTDFRILHFQNPGFKISADFKILAFVNPEFKILDDINILAF